MQGSAQNPTIELAGESIEKSPSILSILSKELHDTEHLLLGTDEKSFIVLPRHITAEENSILDSEESLNTEKTYYDEEKFLLIATDLGNKPLFLTLSFVTYKPAPDDTLIFGENLPFKDFKELLEKKDQKKFKSCQYDSKSGVLTYESHIIHTNMPINEQGVSLRPQKFQYLETASRQDYDRLMAINKKSLN